MKEIDIYQNLHNNRIEKQLILIENDIKRIGNDANKKGWSKKIIKEFKSILKNILKKIQGLKK